MAKQINPNLRKLAEQTYNPNLEVPNLEEITKEAPLKTNQLKRDENGRPTIKLIPLEKTVVNTPTQEEYNTLLQVYECGGWMWASENLPTSINYWERYKEEICIDAINGFGNAPKNAYKNWGIFSSQEFYNKQNITDDMIKEINEYFKNKHE